MLNIKIDNYLFAFLLIFYKRRQRNTNFGSERWKIQKELKRLNISLTIAKVVVLTRTPRLEAYQKTQIWGMSDFRISLIGVFEGRKVYRVIENSTLERMRLVSTLSFANCKKLRPT